MWKQGEKKIGFLSDILASVKQKQADYKERNEFLAAVEAEAKPIRRAAYMQQILKEVVNEGIAKAQADSAAKLPKEKKKMEDFGIGRDEKITIGDPYKYLNGNKGKQ